MKDNIAKIKKYSVIMLKAICTTLAFCMNHNELEILQNDLWIKNTVMRLLNIFNCNILKMCLYFVGFVIIYWIYEKYKEKKYKIKYSRVTSCVLAIAYVIGGYYMMEYPISTSIIQALKAIITFIGTYNIYYTAIYCIYNIVNNDNNIFSTLSSRIVEKLKKHPILYTVIFLLVFWSIHLVLKYPAGMSWDSTTQLAQGMGLLGLSTHHPIFHTFLITSFLKFGIFIGNANIGIFLFVILQALVLAMVIGYGIRFLIDIKAYNWSILLVMIFFGFSSYVVGNIGTVMKDTCYIIFYLLFAILIAKYVLEYEKFWSDFKSFILFIISAIGMSLIRNNGIHVVVITTIVLIIYELKNRNGKFIYKIVSLICVILIPISVNSLLNCIYKPQKGSIAEALSLPFQQTARFVKYNSDKVSEKEKEIINNILPYDDLAELYDPYLSDPVKAEYNREASTEDLIEYFKVWFKQFFKQPLCYVEATLHQNIILLYPQLNNFQYYIKCVHPYNELDDRYEEYFETPELISNIQDEYLEVLKKMHQLPILRVINNMAVYVIGNIVLIIYIMNDKKYKHLICFVPFIVSVLVIILAPCIRGHVRYAFPIIYTFPIMLSCYIL